MAEPPREAGRPAPSLRRALPPRPYSLGRYWGPAAAASKEPSVHGTLQPSAGGSARRRGALRELLGLRAAAPRGWRAEEPGPVGSGGGGLCLEPREHAWMLAAAEGRWEALQELLAAEPGLALRADPVTGYTLLHWLAKHGHHEELILLQDFARRHELPLDVSAPGSGGLTALHLAAMQGHQLAVKVLVGALGADPTRRDHSGHRACHYLPPGAPSSLRELSGAEEWEVEAGGPHRNANNNSSGSVGAVWALRRTPSGAVVYRTPRAAAATANKNRHSTGSGVARLFRHLFPFFQNRSPWVLGTRAPPEC
ncbi:ankyrin repeat domain-containing protein SOWAHD [Erinaceus europaeus]|uniref:Ankyrin repeat domain-containing protein SOWAHD n=1 Tax=Erinaceus europaeus TaxID=9365 RepID=A0ABM3WSE9_ERIEU|nr:ankyrin repeat domain-containing protein SOWAHD [Erinaceus europaeus]XP_060039493.1 ankyrin repeat domain-containing protein SOWAHD [Erinaceus europaeus]